jgi:hypothetical protein
MESLFNTTFNIKNETNNLLYNIINSQDPKAIFLYGIIIIVITFISTKIHYNYNVLIGLVFCSLIIYYIYTYKKQNILTKIQTDKEKFDSLYSKHQILYKYPEIVDFLFYMENFKAKNIQEYDNLISGFENFCKTYEYCLIDYNLINKFFNNLIDQKIKILIVINSFVFTHEQTEYEKILIKQKIEAEKLMDNLLNNLALLYKKKNYYDGYNINTSKIQISNVLPYNILYDCDSKSDNLLYGTQNFLFF